MLSRYHLNGLHCNRSRRSRRSSILGKREDSNENELDIARFSDHGGVSFHSLSEWNIFCQRHRCIIILLVVVHPNFSRSSRIFRKHIAASTGKCVRVTLAKHMADATTRNYFQTATALPYAEWYLKIFTAYEVQQQIARIKLRTRRARHSHSPTHPKHPFSCRICRVSRNIFYRWQTIRRQSSAFV